MEQPIRIGMDTSKSVFQLHGVNAAEEVVLRRKLRRKDMVAFFEKLPPTVVAIEACGASHHWARLLTSFGHEVKLIAAQLVKPYVKRSKNDAADAEALCEAMSRPTMRFVPVKTADQQAVLMLMGVRDRLIRNQTQLSNAIRGFAAEFGMTAATGMDQLGRLLDRIESDNALPSLARELFAAQAAEYAQLRTKIAEVDAKLAAWQKTDLPPSEWSKISVILDHEGVWKWARGTSRKRLSASCERLRSCWRRVGRRLTRADGSRLRSRPITAGARNMAG